MKKILSLTLVALMLVSMIPTALAFENGSRICEVHGTIVCDICNKCPGCESGYCDCSYDGHYTKVEYTATTNEAYTVTVPATLAPGGSGEVAVEGTWGSNRRLVVSADKEVELVNSLNTYDRKTLAVTFSGIKKDGNNTATVTATEAVSVGDIENALFGTWSGAFFYDVEMINVPGTFDIWDSGCVNHYARTHVEFEKGMTWREFVNSKFNTAENTGVEAEDISHGQDAIFSIVTGDDGLEYVAYDGFVVDSIITPDDVIAEGMTFGFTCE